MTVTIIFCSWRYDACPFVVSVKVESVDYEWIDFLFFLFKVSRQQLVHHIW